jgi:hypothetical protein
MEIVFVALGILITSEFALCARWDVQVALHLVRVLLAMLGTILVNRLVLNVLNFVRVAVSRSA